MKTLLSLIIAVSLFYIVSPYSISAEEISVKTPNISFPETVFDFGSVYQGEKVAHAFKFQNIGDDILKISQVRASCGCSKAEASIKEIAPGEFGEIDVVFNTTGFEGKQSKNISVSSNDPLNPTIQLTLKGEVKLEVEIKPRYIEFENVPKYTQVTKQFEIIQRGEQELIVDKITVDKKYLIIDSVEKGKGTYLVSVTLSKDAPVGNFIGRMEVSTNLKRQSEILVGVQGRVVGISLLPERVIFRIPYGTEKVFPVVVSTNCDNCEVLKVQTNTKYLSAEIITLEKFKKYKIDFTVSKEAPVGQVREDVKVYTNCPGETELVIPILASISEKTGKTIEIGYFFERGCLKCEHVAPILKSLKEKFPAVLLKEYDIELKENMRLNEALCEIYGVPEDKRLVTPIIFFGKAARKDSTGGDFLIGESITKENLIELINKYYEDGASLPLDEITHKEDTAEKSIADRFRSFGIFAIIAAGLVDGFNPCAFATIIFFVSYLTLLKRKGREIVIVGLSFTAAVFITYFLIGIGLFEFLKYLSFLKYFTRILYALVATFTLLLGVLSFWDFLKCKKGKAAESILQLPKFLKDKIHSTIKEKASLKRYVLAAFITGFIVSVLELACTGQVYLPTIVYATGISDLRFAAYLYLLLYNIMFIAPLIMVFILAYFGTTAINLSDTLGKNMASIKLLLSILFFIFTAFLVMLLI